MEVVGAPGTTASVSFTAPAGSSNLWVRIAGLGYENKASVSVNSSGSWISLNNTNCVFDAPASSLNGMGGPLNTLSFSVPGLRINPGRVTLTFRFNVSDYVSIGYRVLAVNVLNAAGTKLLSDTKPVLTLAGSSKYLASDIAAGAVLWTNAPLTLGWTGAPIQAKCSDCHATDGSDLKFFGFSDVVIIARSQFHGLTSAQGKQIAAFIRNGSEQALGTPWDPPYQPGPGQAERPYAEWAAGAGLKWVAPADSNTWDYAFSNGIVQFTFTNTLNMRDIPVATPLPVWNEWLPRMSPLESFGTNFQPMVDQFNQMAAQTNAATISTMMRDWQASFSDWVVNNSSGRTSTNLSAQTAYWSSVRWMTIRTWELMHTHRLEGQAQAMFSFPVDPHSWPNNLVFLSSPHFTLPEQGHILGDGTPLSWSYRSHQWYWTMLVLSDSNHRREGASPIDWPYLLAFSTVPATYGVDSSAQSVLALEKSAESGTGDPYTWDNAFFGWAITRTEFLDTYGQTMWKNYDPSYRDTIIRAFMQAYTGQIYSLGRDYFINVDLEVQDGETDNTPGPPGGGPWIKEHGTMMARMKQDGVAQDIIETMRTLGEYLWPSADWSQF